MKKLKMLAKKWFLPCRRTDTSSGKKDKKQFSKPQTTSYRLRANERGSALLLVVIVSVSALFIVASISIVSFLEGKMSHKVKDSTASVQYAISGVELAMKVIRDCNKANPDTDAPTCKSKTVEELCTEIIRLFGAGDPASWQNGSGEDYCLIESGDVKAKVFFLEGDNKIKLTSDEKMNEEDPPGVNKNYYIRSLGVSGEGSEETTRSMESYIFWL